MSNYLTIGERPNVEIWMCVNFANVTIGLGILIKNIQSPCSSMLTRINNQSRLN